jgi:hypothetical protein
MTRLALDTDLTSEQREYLDTVMFSAESLLTVINDILDFSKIEAGRMELGSHAFDVRECLYSSLKMLAVRANEKGALVRLFYDQYAYHGTYVYPSTTGMTQVSPEQDFGDGRWAGTELQFTKRVLHRTTEMVWEQQLRGHLSTSTSVFYSRIVDLITQRGTDDQSLIFRNLQRVKSYGTEVELRGEQPGWPEWVASMAINRPKMVRPTNF